jgi:hypothetical protein
MSWIMEHFCTHRYPQFKASKQLSSTNSHSQVIQTEVLSRAGDLQFDEETKVRGFHSVQTILRCLVKMKPEGKHFQHPDIESFAEEKSIVSRAVDFLMHGSGYKLRNR